MIQEEMKFNGTELRDQGIERTLSKNNDWKDRVLEEIVYISHRLETFTADDIREQCKHLMPTSGKAWGGVICTASKLGLIEKTGRYVQSRIPSNHARPNCEWRKAA